MILDAKWRCERWGHDLVRQTIDLPSAPSTFTTARCRRCHASVVLWAARVEWYQDDKHRLYRVLTFSQDAGGLP